MLYSSTVQKGFIRIGRSHQQGRPGMEKSQLPGYHDYGKQKSTANIWKGLLTGFLGGGGQYLIKTRIGHMFLLIMEAESKNSAIV